MQPYMLSGDQNYSWTFGDTNESDGSGKSVSSLDGLYVVAHILEVDHLDG